MSISGGVAALPSLAEHRAPAVISDNADAGVSAWPGGSGLGRQSARQPRFRGVGDDSTPRGWTVENRSRTAVFRETNTVRSGSASARLVRRYLSTGNNYGVAQPVPGIRIEPGAEAYDAGGRRLRAGSRPGAGVYFVVGPCRRVRPVVIVRQSCGCAVGPTCASSTVLTSAAGSLLLAY